MTTIGFIGLGIMGRPMAANLVKAGYSVVGYSRRSEPAAELVRQGGRSAGSISAVTAESDVLITMLPDSPDVEDVVLGEQGVLAHARPGLLLIDMSTIRPQSAMAIAEAARAVGVRAIDAPVSVAVLAGGLGGNRVLELKAAGMLGRQFAPGVPDRPPPQGPGHCPGDSTRGRRSAAGDWAGSATVRRRPRSGPRLVRPHRAYEGHRGPVGRCYELTGPGTSWVNPAGCTRR